MRIAYTLYRFNSGSCRLAASSQLVGNYVAYQSSTLFRIVGERIERSKVIEVGCERESNEFLRFTPRRYTEIRVWHKLYSSRKKVGRFFFYNNCRSVRSY